MLWNTLLMSVRALRRNVMRSILTVLGIIIGVASVILIVTLGNGAREQVTGQIRDLGNNLLVLSPAQGSGSLFDMADIRALKREVPELAEVAPVANRAVVAVVEGEDWQTQVSGIDDAYFKVITLKIAQGDPFTQQQLRGSQLYCMIGDTVRKELFPNVDPLGAKIRIGNLSCPITAVMASRGSSMLGGDQDNFILAPLKAVQSRLVGGRHVSQVLMRVSDGFNTSYATDDVKDLMRTRRHIGPRDRDDFQVTDVAQITQVLDTVTGALTLFLGAIAAVSLLVGGIGIMNIMLVSVTERTREIGIRLAIGAEEGEIQRQFLLEAIILTSLGGLIGMTIGLGGSFALTRVLNFPFVASPMIAVISVGFSAIIGVIFGYVPARRAARLDPIEALRYE
jgi:putative ABC transport system permease protein